MTREIWSERDKLESNTTPRFLTFCAGETRLSKIYRDAFQTDEDIPPKY